MYKPLMFIIILLLMTGVVFIKADAQQALTWEDCLLEAELHHPDLISAKEQLKQVQEDKGIARSAALPQITTEASGKRAEALTGATAETYAYSVTGKQLLFDGFKTSNAVSEAQENINTSQYNYFVVSSNVRLNLRQIFAQLLMVQDLIELTESIASRRGDNLKLVQLRYDAGREHRGSLLTAEANLANAQFEVEQAKRNLSLYQTKLSKALGWEGRETVMLIGEFKVKEEQRDVPDFEFLADHTPSLKALAAKKDAARYGLNSAKADFFPEVYASASAGRSGSAWAPDGDQWSAGLTVSLPLFEGGNRISKVSKAQARMRQTEADQRSGRDAVIITLEETWGGLQDALETVEVKKRFLEAGEERAKIANSQYSTGLISFDDWIIIEDNLVNARKAHLSAQANALIAEAQWIQAKGGTLEYDKKR